MTSQYSELGSFVGSVDDYSDDDNPFENKNSPKLNKWHGQIFMNSKQKNIRKTKDIINELAFKIGLVKGSKQGYAHARIIEEAEYYCRQIFEKELMPKIYIKIRVAISLFISCSLYKFPITEAKMIDVSGLKLSEKRFKKYVLKVKENLTEFKISEHEQKKQLENEIESMIYNIQDLEIKEKKQITHLIHTAKEKGFDFGFNKKGFAAAIIYGVARKNGIKKYTQAFLAKWANVHQSTISNAYKHALRHIDFYEPYKGLEL